MIADARIPLDEPSALLRAVRRARASRAAVARAAASGGYGGARRKGWE
jgi:hypothetical protein